MASLYRGLHSLTAVGSHLWLFGGAPKSGAMMDDLWVLDTETMAWEQVHKAGQVRAACSCFRLRLLTSALSC